MNKQNKQNKICICMLYYNSSQFIHDAITSIINQSYKNWELYVYDDGSEKKELNILEKELKLIKGKYTLIKGSHKKQFYGRITLFNIVEGDIVLTLDSDDKFLNKDFFKYVNNKFNKKNVDILYFNYTDNLYKKTKKSNTLNKFKQNNTNQINEIKKGLRCP